jgi:hypothetical protein
MARINFSKLTSVSAANCTLRQKHLQRNKLQN